ncbi:transporter substrate-binding domain-containing protein [Chitinivorax sp. B]|uniref:substrate-binding periplasmic protein n=1 Tax=Chitinivorax sp. B TaxID=2502235 RepID=UPI001485A4CE|nr:transporter substrate-binding domain-containing protein [Chitinivorax sp. B]
MPDSISPQAYSVSVTDHTHLLIGIVSYLLSIPVHADTPALVRVPQAESTRDARNHYPINLLKLALSKLDDKDFEVTASNIRMTQSRAMAELAQGKQIDVAWTMTSAEREQQLLPIRIPIYKGLLGWRLLLIHNSRQIPLAAVNSLPDLAQFKAGQGHDWPDTAILRQNGLPIEISGNYDGLFKMLTVGRIDYFPRGLNEIGDEWRLHAKDGLMIEQHLVLQYPTACYFFVNRHNTELANTLHTGLELAIKDGSFDALFNKYFKHDIEQARLGTRTILRLKNPLLPPQTPLHRSELWFMPN